MNVLVTGGLGFIGSHIVEELDKQNHKIKIIDNFRTGNINNIPKSRNITIIRGDILDYNLLKKELKDIDYVFHLAAIVSVVESIQDPESTLMTNTIGTLNVLKACVENKVKKIIISSSSAIYGDNPTKLKKENLFPDPKCTYALSKLDDEYLAKTFYEVHDINYVCLRYFNVFGPRQDPSSPYSGVISIFSSKTTKNEDLIIYGTGKQTRDFIFVKDIVKANLLAMEKGQGVYNVGTGKSTSINELANSIIKLTKSKSKIIYKEARKGGIMHSTADISKTKKELNFAPQYKLEDGLKLTLKYFKS